MVTDERAVGVEPIVMPTPPTGWAMETMMMINDLTPEIKGKSFDPGWFKLRQRLEAIEERLRVAESSGGDSA